VTDVAAILLAAGQSKRMGAFKPLLPFGPRSVIETCIDTLQRGGCDPVVVVVGHRGEELRAHLSEFPGVSFATNPDPCSQMGASIACGVRVLPDDARAVVIALTDQPAVPAGVVSALIAAWRQGAQITVPQYEGLGGHPVLLDLKFRGELSHLDAQGGLRSLLQDRGNLVRRVAVETAFIARDIDTWDDYRALYREVFGSEPPAAEQIKCRESGNP
jgi:molybdenum cofactor cytidylyltransferase